MLQAIDGVHFPKWPPSLNVTLPYVEAISESGLHSRNEQF